MLIFQSTLPRRERLILNNNLIFCLNFNPRSREGSDTDGCTAIVLATISIHAPAKGATQTTLTTSQMHTYFNPRSREGSDTATLRARRSFD